MIRKVRENFVNNKNKKSPRKLAKENNCGHAKIVNGMRDDQGLRSYKKIVVSQLTDGKRFLIFIWSRNHFGLIKCRKIAFSGEKIFDEDIIKSSIIDMLDHFGFIEPKN